jgi:hypothetical protein
MDKVDLISGAGLSLIGILLIFVVIPLGTVPGVSFGLSPTVFPTILAIGMTMCAVGLTVQAWLRLRAGMTPRPVPISRWNLLMLVASAALILIGIVAIDHFRIIYAGPILIAALMLFLGDRNIVRIGLTSTLPVAAMYVLAYHVLRTPLP